MCNIAGYVGTKPAAPILVDMMRRQEGWDCGHYTGVATLDNGKLHVEKVVGDLDIFLARKDLAQLPGTIGMIHSRTPGGLGQKNDNWAHPFLATGGRMAYIANGCGGVFKNWPKEKGTEVYKKLRAAGYVFGTATEEGNNQKNCMPDGYYVHSSEIVCQDTQYYADRGMRFLDACDTACTLRPSERVGLFLTEDEPDCIVWARINYPMFVGVADHGMYMATTPQAMPEDARNITLLTPLSVGKVYADRVETRPNISTEVTIAPITPSVWKACYEAMEKELSEKETDHDSLDKLIRPLFSEATCPPESAVNYAIMNEFERSGRLQINRYRVPGTAPDATAPTLKATLK